MAKQKDIDKVGICPFPKSKYYGQVCDCQGCNQDSECPNDLCWAEDDGTVYNCHGPGKCELPDDED
jgi:flavoprotein